MTRVVGFGAALEDIWPEFSAYLLSQLILGELNLFRIVGQFWSNPTFLNLAKFMRCATLKLENFERVLTAICSLTKDKTINCIDCGYWCCTLSRVH